MNESQLERHQVWIYLAAILTGLALGGAAPALASLFEALLWPALAMLLYVIFIRIRLARLPAPSRSLPRRKPGSMDIAPRSGATAWSRPQMLSPDLESQRDTP